MSVLKAARTYRDLGMIPIPVKARSEEPSVLNWTDFEPTDDALTEHFCDGTNVGILTGSAGLIAVSLEHPKARSLALALLPETRCKVGRPGAPCSQYLYRVDALMPTVQYADPLDGTVLFKRRGDGDIVLVPPSVLPCGELLRCEEQGEPTEISADLLSASVAQLAGATLLAIHWPTGEDRYIAALALGGRLAQAGWGRRQTAEFVHVITLTGRDGHYERRGNDALAGFDRVAASGAATGAPPLAKVFDERVVLQVVEWLGLRAESASQPAPQLAGEPRILDRFAESLHARGVVGEDQAAKLLYLALTSRLFKRPVSVILKGPSSAGKSFVTDAVLAHFPKSAYYALTAMSERALAYSNEPLSHRVLVINEAGGLPSDIGSYLLRSLLSEGKLRYETVDRTGGGQLRSRLIERDGPTGAILTTTRLKVHPENETRLLSILITDSPEQTRAVMEALARDDSGDHDCCDWQQFQEWLAGQDSRVVVPYAKVLATLTPPVAVRLRRDFKMLLQLVRSQALLHQVNRPRDGEGRIVATLDDYEVVRELVIDLISEGVEKSVPPTVRQTVEALRSLMKDTGGPLIGLPALSQRLGLDKGSVSRRVGRAVGLGYLKNLEDKQGKPAQLQLADPLPEDQEVLPTAAEVARCTVAGDSGERGGSSDGSASEGAEE